MIIIWPHNIHFQHHLLSYNILHHKIICNASGFAELLGSRGGGGSCR
jgi:hypothetical protein